MSLTATRSHGSSQWVCRSCATTIRAFSTTAARPAIAPESPRYIEVPRPLQQFVKSEKVIKGKLPVPKDVFRGARAANVNPTWFDKTTPEPRDRPIPLSNEAPRTLWKQRMADRRRQNLREGVLELHNRRRREEQTQQIKDTTKLKDLRRRQRAPDRLDERLTRPSVNEVLRDIFTKGHEWTGKPVTERRTNYETHQAAKSEARKDAIHTLYMHARHFITTEAQLSDAIDKAFTQEDGTPITDSMWDHDAPLTTQEMMSQMTGTERQRNADRRASERMKKIAEELTGGKISNEWSPGPLSQQ